MISIYNSDLFKRVKYTIESSIFNPEIAALYDSTVNKGLLSPDPDIKGEAEAEDETFNNDWIRSRIKGISNYIRPSAGLVIKSIRRLGATLYIPDEFVDMISGNLFDPMIEDGRLFDDYRVSEDLLELIFNLTIIKDKLIYLDTDQDIITACSKIASESRDTKIYPVARVSNPILMMKCGLFH